MKTYFRNCPNTKNNPNCKKHIGYIDNKNCEKAEIEKRECSACKGFGLKRSEESNLNISKALRGKKKSAEHSRKNGESHKGQIAWNKGRTNIEIFGKERSDNITRKVLKSREGFRHTEEAKEKIRLQTKGKTYKELYGDKEVKCGFKKGKDNVAHKPEVKEKNRLRCLSDKNPSKNPEARRKIRLKRIETVEEHKFNGGQMKPNYNSKACEYFNNLMIEANIFIQHAENGGEFYIKELGYWVDGYDKENNVVYEWDEKHHFDKSNGLLNEKDIYRQLEIEKHLNCLTIRIKQK